MNDTFHPLDPLSAEEFTTVAKILAQTHDVGASWRYTSVELSEPSKAEVAAFDNNGTRPDRRALATCLDTTQNATYKAVISLTSGEVLSWNHIPGVQPNFTVDEWEEADAVLRGHPDVIAALARRGITDMDLVFMDTWTYGDAVMPEKYRGRRLGWSDTWVRAADGANPYAGPVNGFHCVIDMNSMELLDIEDTFTVERPTMMGEYVPRHVPERLRKQSTRESLQPLHITQPDGPSFTIEGNKLQWQNWSLRVGFNYREGMTLHAVTYNDNGRVRSVANRMSFAEMMVPYRDHCEDHYRRTAFDIGEWGIGFMTTSLELGCDCLGEIRYLDAVLHNSKGEPYTIKNAICIHEEDNAVLWKHVDHDHGAQVRRMRRLTVSFHVTVANYEYLTYWRFYQDGNIECEVRATGIMVVSNFTEGAATRRALSWTTAPTRPTTNISSSRGWIWTSTEPRTPCTPRKPRSSPSAPRIHTDSRCGNATPRCVRNRKENRTSAGKPSAPGRSSTTTLATASVPHLPTSWCRAQPSPRCSTPPHRSWLAAAPSSTHFG
ncbi:Probable copper amine oxidase [Mycobacteroides abscessus]|nr:Probable copper amine oxidase [Mycobacteroides abscessus]